MINKLINRDNYNIVFLIFVASIFLDYFFINKLFYFLYVISFIVFLYDILKLHKSQNYKIIYNKGITVCVIYFLLYTLYINILNITTISYRLIVKMSIIYFLFMIILLKCIVIGRSYIVNFYKYFIVFMNTFIIINFYELISKKSIFYSFIISDSKYWQLGSFGTNNFRTFSIFIHPIIYGSFLVAIFWCNKYIINNKIKYVLQVIVIINLYYTKSRSAWVAIVITLFIYYLKAFFAGIKNTRIRFTYKKIINLIIITIFLTFTILVFSNNFSIILNKIIERIITITNDSYNDISRLQRLGTIKVVNNYMLNNGVLNFLFGNGYDSVKEFMMSHCVVIPNFTTTDNQYVSFFYDFGLVGLLLYVFIVIFSIIKFFRSDKILDIGNLTILCFLSISISMFFFESYGWIDVFTFLIITMSFLCIRDIKKVGE